MDALRIDDPALKIDPEIVELVIDRQKQEEEKRKLETISKAKLKVAEETAEIEYERIALEEEVQKERERVAAEEKARKERERLEAEMIAHPQSTLAVLPEYNFCGFCKNWQSRSDSDNDALAVDGKCKIFKHTVLSTTENCDNFTPHFGRINHSYFGKSFPNHSGQK